MLDGTIQDNTIIQDLFREAAYQYDIYLKLLLFQVKYPNVGRWWFIPDRSSVIGVLNEASSVM